MTPKDVFDRVVKASVDNDAAAALGICHTIRAMDLFFGRRTPVCGEFKITTTHRDKPCQGCGERIPAGSNVQWLPGYGCWHDDCLRKHLNGIPYEHGVILASIPSETGASSPAVPQMTAPTPDNNKE